MSETIPPNMNVNHSLQAALDWACNRGRYLGGWHPASDSVRRGLLALRRMAEQTPAETIAAGKPELSGKNQLFDDRKKVVELLKLHSALAVEEISSWLNLSPHNSYQTVRRLEAGGWITADKPKGARQRRFQLVKGLFLLPLAFCLLHSSAAAADVTLAWDASPSTNVVGYKIYWGTDSTNYTNSLTVSNVLTATVTNLQSGITYYFAATAFDSESYESDYSNEVNWFIANNRLTNLRVGTLKFR